jgi:hypothetical protein
MGRKTAKTNRVEPVLATAYCSHEPKDRGAVASNTSCRAFWASSRQNICSQPAAHAKAHVWSKRVSILARTLAALRVPCYERCSRRRSRWRGRSVFVVCGQGDLERQRNRVTSKVDSTWQARALRTSPAIVSATGRKRSWHARQHQTSHDATRSRLLLAWIFLYNTRANDEPAALVERESVLVATRRPRAFLGAPRESAPSRAGIMNHAGDRRRAAPSPPPCRSEGARDDEQKTACGFSGRVRACGRGQKRAGWGQKEEAR